MRNMHLKATRFGHPKMPVWKTVLYTIAIIILAIIACPIIMIAMQTIAGV